MPPKIAHCIVPNCKSKSGMKDITLFPIPKYRKCREKWLRSIGRLDLLLLSWSEVHKVCHLHFENQHLLIDEKGVRFMERDAVPSSILPLVPATKTKHVIEVDAQSILDELNRRLTNDSTEKEQTSCINNSLCLLSDINPDMKPDVKPDIKLLREASNEAICNTLENKEILGCNGYLPTKDTPCASQETNCDTEQFVVVKNEADTDIEIIETIENTDPLETFQTLSSFDEGSGESNSGVSVIVSQPNDESQTDDAYNTNISSTSRNIRVPKNFLLESAPTENFGIRIVAVEGSYKRPLDEVETQSLKKSKIEPKKVKQENIKEPTEIEIVCKQRSNILTLFNIIPKEKPTNEPSLAYKRFCLRLYYTSPKSYITLFKSLCLPPLSVLKNWWDLKTGITEELMSSLKLRVEVMNESQKSCSVCVGYMKMTPHLGYDAVQDCILGFQDIDGLRNPMTATRVLVVMIRGLYDDWEQLVSFTFLSSTKSLESVNTWIDTIIINLIQIGYKIHALITDTHTDFEVMLRLRKVTVEEPFFYLENMKIFYLFDSHSLFNSLRNEWMKSSIRYEGKLASWTDVLALYTHDKDKSLRLAPKITAAHVQPNNFHKQDVKYAAQVFSRSVAAAISTYIEMNVMHETAKETVDFILKLNELFDLLNSSSSADASVSSQTPYTCNATELSFLSNMFTFFKHLDCKLALCDQFCITLRSLIMIKSTGFNSSNNEFKWTRRLTMDSLKKFFSKVVRETNLQPTCLSFIKIYRRCFGNELLKNYPNTKKGDVNEFAVQAMALPSIITSSMKHPKDPKREKFNKVLVKPEDYDGLVGVTTINKDMIQVSCYMFNNIIEKHHCSKLSNYVLHFRKKGSKTKVQAPGCFLSFIKELDKAFWEYYSRKFLDRDIIHNLMLAFENIKMEHAPCQCFPILYTKKLFALLRVNYSLKEKNINHVKVFNDKLVKKEVV